MSLCSKSEVPVAKELNLVMHWIQLFLLSAAVLLATGSSIEPAIVPSQQLGSCPITEQREQARERIQLQTASIIRDSVLPTRCNPGGYRDLPASSCDDIPQECSSGWYWLETPNKEVVQVYCDLERKCGCDSSDTQQPWMRVAYLDMTDLKESCPEGLRMIKSPKRSCRRSYQAFQTSIIPYRTYGYNYSHVCGRIIAYQYGITEGLAPINNNANSNRVWSIEQRSFDGIVVTHGQPGSREHIWSFVAASHENSNGISSCSCINNRSETVRNLRTSSVIGDSYFCDTGVPRGPVDNQFYPDDPLWDGQGCGLYNTCCEFNNPPWFCKDLPAATNEDIEVRFIAAATHTNLEGEDTPVEKIEILVR